MMVVRDLGGGVVLDWSNAVLVPGNVWCGTVMPADGDPSLDVTASFMLLSRIEPEGRHMMPGF